MSEKWITDRPPRVDEVRWDEQTLVTMSGGRVAAWWGPTIRSEWGKQAVAWLPRPEPYQPPAPEMPEEMWAKKHDDGFVWYYRNQPPGCTRYIREDAERETTTLREYGACLGDGNACVRCGQWLSHLQSIESRYCPGCGRKIERGES